MRTLSSVHSRLIAIRLASNRRARCDARHAEGLELDIAIAQADTQNDLAAGDDVESGKLLGDMQRRQQRQQQHAGIQPQPRCLGGEPGQHRHELQHLERMRAVMRGLGDRVEAKPIRQPNEGQSFLEAARNVLAGFRLTAHHETELELRRHFGCSSCSINARPSIASP